MPCALRAGLALYIMICCVGWAQNRPSKKTSGITAEALRPGSTIRYGQRQWKLIRQIKATFNPGRVEDWRRCSVGPACRVEDWRGAP
jgi:hypothetical protein